MPAILFYWICENHNELEYRKFANYGFTLASFFSGAGTLFSGIGQE